MGEVIFESISNKFDNIYSIYITIFVVLSGIFILIHDARRLEIRKDHKGYKIAKVIGYVYIIGGASLYVVTLII